MNFVFLSPHFPPNYYHFPVRLKEHGVNVLGLADASYDSLRPELKAAFGEYYRVDDMHSYDQMVRALGYFTHRHGKLDRIDSQNEYWLETEARLRTDFNITGIKTDTIARIKRKSLMKQTFVDAGVRVARGMVARSMDEARLLVAETGYPLVAKPNVGVGAAATYKIQTDAELESFFQTKPPIDYILEEFIKGQIFTFDGITDREGEPVFISAMTYSTGIMETVLYDELVYYYTLRDIPADLEAAGRRVLRAFDVRERFFHFEFFRAEDGGIVALEVNMRPPGGLTTDMMNYACDLDVYNGWAGVMAGKGWVYPGYARKFHCCYVGRKFNRGYAHSQPDVLARYGERISHHESISGVFSAALGNYGFLVRSPDLDEILEMARYIQEKA